MERRTSQRLTDAHGATKHIARRQPTIGFRHSGGNNPYAKFLLTESGRHDDAASWTRGVRMQARAYLIEPGRNPWAAEAQPRAVGRTGNLEAAVRMPRGGSPEWAGLVEEALGDRLDLATMAGPGAALYLPNLPDGYGVMFCFGTGRHLVDSNAWVPGFGMRAALNAAVRSGDAAVNSLAALSFATIEESPVSGRLRGASPRGMTQFTVDTAVDRIRGVRAVNLARRLGVGLALEGATSLAVEVNKASSLRALAKRLHDLGCSRQYESRWPQLDSFVAVEDDTEIDGLNDCLAKVLSTTGHGVGLHVPREVEQNSRVRIGTSATAVELSVENLTKRWKGDLAALLARSVVFEGDDNQMTYKVRDLITAEIVRSDRVYLLDRGRWQSVANERLTAIRAALAQLEPWPHPLKPWPAPAKVPKIAPAKGKKGKKPSDEGEYLKTYLSDPNFLVLDQQLVGTKSAKSRMEFCDLLHREGAFVHVKRLDTKGLSHLAAQATGSALRWTTELAFRDAVRETAEAAAGKETTWRAVLSEPPRQSEHPIVFAIGTGRSDALPDLLSTLAMLHFHRAVVMLQSRGFTVQYAVVPER